MLLTEIKIIQKMNVVIFFMFFFGLGVEMPLTTLCSYGVGSARAGGSRRGVCEQKKKQKRGC